MVSANIIARIFLFYLNFYNIVNLELYFIFECSIKKEADRGDIEIRNFL